MLRIEERREGINKSNRNIDNMVETCGICKEREATTKCRICAIPLCETCAIEITIEDTHPAHRIKGITTPGITGEAVKRKIVCPECVAEVDIF